MPPSRRRYRCRPCENEDARWRRVKFKQAHPHRNWARQARANASQRAKRHELDFNLSTAFLEALLSKQEHRCWYCDKDLYFGFHRGQDAFQDDSAHLDRVLPDRGYVTTNVVVACGRCNILKKDAKLEELTFLVEGLKRFTN